MRVSRIFLASFIDGFSMAGLFGQLRMPGAPTRVFDSPQSGSSDRSLLEITFAELHALPDAAAHEHILTAEKRSQREAKYARAGLFVGGGSLLVCFGLFIYLVTHNQDLTGGGILGAVVLTWLLRPISTLRKRHHSN